MKISSSRLIKILSFCWARFYTVDVVISSDWLVWKYVKIRMARARKRNREKERHREREIKKEKHNKIQVRHLHHRAILPHSVSSFFVSMPLQKSWAARHFISFCPLFIICAFFSLFFEPMCMMYVPFSIRITYDYVCLFFVRFLCLCTCMRLGFSFVYVSVCVLQDKECRDEMIVSAIIVKQLARKMPQFEKKTKN